MANKSRLVELSMVPPLAQEVASQIDGAVGAKARIAALTPVATPDATDATTVITLANANKAKINSIIAALKA
ncbi:hypothetical protein ACG3QR_32950 [Pseudomonas aeruginosa]